MGHLLAGRFLIPRSDCREEQRRGRLAPARQLASGSSGATAAAAAAGSCRMGTARKGRRMGRSRGGEGRQVQMLDQMTDEMHMRCQSSRLGKNIPMIAITGQPRSASPPPPRPRPPRPPPPPPRPHGPAPPSTSPGARPRWAWCRAWCRSRPSPRGAAYARPSPPARRKTAQMHLSWPSPIPPPPSSSGGEEGGGRRRAKIAGSVLFSFSQRRGVWERAQATRLAWRAGRAPAEVLARHGWARAGRGWAPAGRGLGVARAGRRAGWASPGLGVARARRSSQNSYGPTDDDDVDYAKLPSRNGEGRLSGLDGDARSVIIFAPFWATLPLRSDYFAMAPPPPSPHPPNRFIATRAPPRSPRSSYVIIVIVSHHRHRRHLHRPVLHSPPVAFLTSFSSRAQLWRRGRP